MTFSDFAKMMYPLIGMGQQKWSFVIFLTDLIIENPLAKSNSTQNNIDNRNPLSKYAPNTLTKFYNGQRNLSQSISGEIISYLDQSKFCDYLMDLPTDVIVLIGKALKQNNIEVTNNDIIVTCVNLFVAIIYDCAKKDKTRSKGILKETPYEQFRGILPKGCNLSLEAFIQLEKNRLWWESIQKNNK